jgi:hypothetical protein
MAEHPVETAKAAVVRHTEHHDVAGSVTTPMVHPTATQAFPARPPVDPPPVWGNVMPRNLNFTGRGELFEQLGKRLTSGTTAMLPSGLPGLGGKESGGPARQMTACRCTSRKGAS